MLFTQIEFAVFLAAVAAFLLCVRHAVARKRMLLVASYYFYAYWDWRFLGLILFSTVVDYCVALRMKKTDSLRARKILLVVSLVCNLGLLGFFKYYNFFAASFADAFGPVLAKWGIAWNFETLGWIILPVGISFYTFQTLSYTIDVYRRRLEPCTNFFDFALFVAFFPQLVAGPIVRASEFLPQLTGDRPLTWSRAFLGFRQFTFGIFKKVFIADRLALFVDEVFGNAGAYDGVTTWLAVLCYAVQIYCDFSGYSDMAIGIARGLGYDFNENFAHPYIARSPTEFWRRWHISLSSWLRDYLYIPLGGNRKGRIRTYINLLLTMLLGGLWHGAAWVFVFWGLLHGLGLAVDKAIFQKIDWGKRSGGVHLLSSLMGWAVTMMLVLVAWVFFRSTTGGFEQASRMLDTMFIHTGGVRWLHPFSLFALGLMAIVHALHATRLATLRDLPADRLHTPVILFLLWWLVLAFPPTGFQPFIYFQF